MSSGSTSETKSKNIFGNYTYLLNFELLKMISELKYCEGLLYSQVLV